VLQIRLELCAVWGRALWGIYPHIVDCNMGIFNCNTGKLHYGDYLQYGDYTCNMGLLQYGDNLQFGVILSHFAVQYGEEVIFKFYLYNNVRN
jgi:hypothetical protein